MDEGIFQILGIQERKKSLPLEKNIVCKDKENWEPKWMRESFKFCEFKGGKNLYHLRKILFVTVTSRYQRLCDVTNQ